jgi:type IV pilus assembly protein PilC
MNAPQKPRHNERLSAEQSVEAVGQIAELTKTGLPLVPGLRALAAESGRGLMGRGPSSRMFLAMAKRLERGATFEEAVAAIGPRMPAHIRAIFTTGAKTGQLAASLEELVDLDRSRLEFRQKIRMTMAYPVFLLTALACLFALIGGMVVPSFEKIFDDFETELPAMTEAVVALSGNTTFVLIGLLVATVLLLWCLWMLPGPAWLRGLQKSVPFIGPLRRWGGMVRFTRLMGILLECRVPLPEALRIAADVVGDPDLSAGGKRAAACVEGGGSLVEGLAVAGVFPPTLIPLVGWGQQNGTLPEAFRTATEVFQGRAETHVGLLNVILTPLVFLIICITVPFLIIALFIPFISLIVRLT